ncbi:MAG: DUF177 domain-containing protein [Proteobacteria bacterium]|nr:DUF177 domain-containing protein [Pseudomonadota bacterium]
MTNSRAIAEFSRLVPVDAIGVDGAAFRMQADVRERVALARRLDLESVADLQMDVSVQRTAIGLVRLNVDFSANVVQSCVVTLEPVEAKVTDRFSLLCEGGQKRGKKSDTEGEVFVDPFGEDPIEPLDDGRIDVGELVVQYLSLSLNPYPRTPGIKSSAMIASLGIEGVGASVEVDIMAAADEVLEDKGPTDDKGAQEDHSGVGQRGTKPFAVLEGWRTGAASCGRGGDGSGAA